MDLSFAASIGAALASIPISGNTVAVTSGVRLPDGHGATGLLARADDLYFDIGFVVGVTLFLIVAFALVTFACRLYDRHFDEHGHPKSRRYSPEEDKASAERLLDAISEAKAWGALADGDRQAFREEERLVELRRLRRLNERD